MDREKVLQTTDNLKQRKAKWPVVAPILDDLYPPRPYKRRGTVLDMLIGTILSQNTTDRNSGQAMQQLKERYPTYEAVLAAPEAELIDTIRIAGLGNQKGPRIKRALQTLLDERGEFDLEFLGEMDADEARAWLTSIKGIGLKTASIVISFGFNGKAFPVDTHVNRVSQRIGFTPQGTTPDKAHYIMEAIVPPEDYFSAHLQLIQHGRTLCKARSPKCSECPIKDHCDYYQG